MGEQQQQQQKQNKKRQFSKTQQKKVQKNILEDPKVKQQIYRTKNVKKIPDLEEIMKIFSGCEICEDKYTISSKKLNKVTINGGYGLNAYPKGLK
jgi:glutaredoxin-related protein